MEQGITIKIAGRDYKLKVSGPEMERLMRLAAEDVNGMMAKYEERFPLSSLEEKLSFVALNEAMGKISARNKLSSANEEACTLNAEIGNYLKEKESN